MKKTLFSLTSIMALLSCSSFARSESPTTFGQFGDQRYGPVSTTADFSFNFTFSAVSISAVMFDVYFCSPAHPSFEHLHKSSATVTVSPSKPYTSPTMTIPKAYISETGNQFTFYAVAITGTYANQEIKKTITVDSKSSVTLNNPEVGKSYSGPLCYFAFKEGELIAGCNTYTIKNYSSYTLNPEFNKLAIIPLSFEYRNAAGLSENAIKSSLRIYEGYDQFRVGYLGQDRDGFFREFDSKAYRINQSGFRLYSLMSSGNYALSLRNLELKELSEKEEGDIKTSYIYLPAGRGPINESFHFRCSLSGISETQDSVTVDLIYERDHWHFGSYFNSDYSIGIGKGEYA